MTEKLSRRGFLMVAAAGAATVAGLQLIQKADASESVQGEHQWAMVIDQDKCIGCGYCVTACRATNDTSPDISWTPVLEAGEVGSRKVYLPRPCMQCAKAPCVDVCPVKASYYRPDGIVMMDYDRCIGCRYCEVACPYRARSFNWKKFDGSNPAVPDWGEPEVERRPRGVPEKCAFCYQRIDRGLALGLTPGVDPDATPACVGICPVKARTFGDLNDPDSPVSKFLADNHNFRLREDLGTDPRVYYIPANSEA
jgi:phenylacetyl-CoA:acceptor oxidoreductase subunit 1